MVTTDGTEVLPINPKETPDEDIDALVNVIQGSAGQRVEYLSEMIEKDFKDRPEDALKFFTVNGKAYDVRNPEDLRSFQRAVHHEICHEDEFRYTEDALTKRFKKSRLSKEQRTAFEEALTDGQLAAMSLPDDQGEARHYAMHAIYSGTQSQVGFPIEPSALALQMTPCVDEADKTMYTSALLGEKIRFFPYQVSGAASCLASMLGHIPLPADAPQAAREAADSLKALKIGGKFICDQTGMGKTIMLLVIIYYAKYHVMKNNKGERIYKVSQLVVPSAVIKQWADEILRFPELELIISYDDMSLPESQFAGKFVSSTAINKMNHPSIWPSRSRYIFDEKDPKTGLTIMLTTHDTLVSRGLEETRTVISKGKRHEPPKYDNAGNEIWKEEPEVNVTYRNKFEGMVGIGAVDEAHKLKSMLTKRWLAFSRLKSDYVFVLGATPMANVGSVSSPTKTGF